MSNALETLSRLRQGNKRFVREELRFDASAALRQRLVEGQSPVAVIIGCSDSRVPTEIIFDQDVGDLFVVRVAGNVVQPSQIGSVEFAAQSFGVQLVVVLGHTLCGAISATLDQLAQPEAEQSRNLASIVNCIRPAIEKLMPEYDSADKLKEAAVRENVRYSAEALRHGSDIIEGLIDDGKLLIVGAEYRLESGEVDFFDGVPVNQES